MCVCEIVYICVGGVLWCTQRQFSSPTIENPIVVGGLLGSFDAASPSTVSRVLFSSFFFPHRKTHFTVCITVCYFISFGSASSRPGFIITVFFLVSYLSHIVSLRLFCPVAWDLKSAFHCNIYNSKLVRHTFVIRFVWTTSAALDGSKILEVRKLKPEEGLTLLHTGVGM